MTAVIQGAAEGVDHRTVDWTRVRGSTFRLDQRFRYHYPGPIDDLRHWLMAVPPLRHGDQQRIEWRVDVTGATAHTHQSEDGFGNVVVGIRAARVDQAVEIDVAAVVEREARGPVRLPPSSLSDRRWTEPSALTRPDDRLRQVARELTRDGARGLDLARAITSWTHDSLRYTDGITSVRTTAAKALAVGGGVCQDYAHVMLAVCRLAGLPARYVSGHLLGEGGSHAWVEVLAEAPGRPDQVWAVPFDATHDRQAGLSYLTIAVGRDYADIAPTSGTYRAPVSGRLTVTKRLGLASVEWITA